jgi:DNA-binding transcriptional regulator YbjK
VTRTDTRQRLLDAALPLVARGGLKALTHRAVESAAGVARGSATYHLGSRHEIVEGLMERLADLDVAAMDEALNRLAVDHLASGEVDLRAMVGGLVGAITAERDRVLARYWLMLEAARDESLQPIARRWREAFAALPEPVLTRLGVRAPATVSRDLVALLDGVIFEHVCTGQTDDLRERAVEAVVAFVTDRTPATRPAPPGT